MKNPKVGERVNFYHAEIFRHNGVQYWGPLACEIVSTSEALGTVPGYISVKDIYGNIHRAHHKCCRRLRKKAKKVPREKYIVDYRDCILGLDYLGTTAYSEKEQAEKEMKAKCGVRVAKFREVLDE